MSVLVNLSRFKGRLVPSSLRKVIVATVVDMGAINPWGIAWISWLKRWLNIRRGYEDGTTKPNFLQRLYLSINRP
jgi:hypothetical protein